MKQKYEWTFGNVTLYSIKNGCNIERFDDCDVFKHGSISVTVDDGRTPYTRLGIDSFFTFDEAKTALIARLLKEQQHHIKKAQETTSILKQVFDMKEEP